MDNLMGLKVVVPAGYSVPAKQSVVGKRIILWSVSGSVKEVQEEPLPTAWELKLIVLVYVLVVRL